MKRIKNKELRIRVWWLAGLLLLFSWLFFQWSVPSGEWQTRRIFPGSSRRVGDFYPAERVAELIEPETTLATRTITVEPAYLRVRVPRRFREVEITMKYHNPNNIDWRLGVRETTEAWRWRLFKPSETRRLVDGRLESKVSLPLSGIELEQGSYIFIISLPGLSERQAQFIVEELSFNFRRAPLTWKFIKSQIGKLFLSSSGFPPEADRPVAETRGSSPYV